MPKRNNPKKSRELKPKIEKDDKELALLTTIICYGRFAKEYIRILGAMDKRAKEVKEKFKEIEYEYDRYYNFREDTIYSYLLDLVEDFEDKYKEPMKVVDFGLDEKD